MKREQQDSDPMGDYQANNPTEDTDNQTTDEDISANDKEIFINTNNANIDTMREDSKDSDALKMDTIKERLSALFNRIAKSMKSAWNSYINISGSNLLFPFYFFIGSILYLELILHILIYRSIDIKIIYPVLFAIPLGLFLTFLTGLFRRSINKIVIWVLIGLTTIVFLTQLVYFSVFKLLFTFQSLGMAGAAVSEFGADIITAIKANIGGMILLIVPMIILALINNQIDYQRRGIKEQGVLLGGSVVFQVLAMVALLLFGRADYSPYDLYYNSQVHDLCGKQLGITTMTRIDIVKLVLGQETLVLADTMALQPVVVPEPTESPTPKHVPKSATKSKPNTEPTVSLPPTPIPIDSSPNVMDIDFNALAENENNDTIQTLHKYFASATPTNKNEYTGMFEGYNLIMITAEGFSPYAINKEKTPTLYRLVREGFVFNNFYTALWQTSTSDGEYVAMTGLIPVGTRSMYQGRSNRWPISLGHQFNQLGIESKAYHNHTYTYYERNETHPNLGYRFKAVGNGLVLDSTKVWPASDLDLINATVGEYAEDDQFHVYYLTVSGHMNYTFAGNSMASKNRNLVKDLPYSEDAKAYIACQIELDKALEQLLAKLEQAGVADRTVIALSADHYPYGWEKNKLDELAGHEIESNFEIYKNNFILWNEGMKKSILVEEPCSSLDILPTLSNLFGLEYDSRLLMGQDILSDAEPLVILSNRSFITDKVMYNSETGEATSLTQEELPNDYISNMNNIIKNKFTVSESILKKDYYRYVFDEKLIE